MWQYCKKNFKAGREKRNMGKNSLFDSKVQFDTVEKRGDKFFARIEIQSPLDYKKKSTAKKKITAKAKKPELEGVFQQFIVRKKKRVDWKATTVNIANNLQVIEKKLKECNEFSGKERFKIDWNTFEKELPAEAVTKGRKIVEVLLDTKGQQMDLLDPEDLDPVVCLAIYFIFIEHGWKVDNLFKLYGINVDPSYAKVRGRAEKICKHKGGEFECPVQWKVTLFAGKKLKDQIDPQNKTMINLEKQCIEVTLIFPNSELQTRIMQEMGLSKLPRQVSALYNQLKKAIAEKISLEIEKTTP